MNKTDITAEIESTVSTKYNLWTIGITTDPAERKQQHSRTDEVKHWKQWKADSESVARAVERDFRSRTPKMKGGTGGDIPSGHAVYVYIF